MATQFVGVKGSVLDIERAASIGAVCTLATAVIFVIINGGPSNDDYARWAVSLVIATGLTAWFVNDASTIMANLSPDQFLLSIVHFYSDLCKMLACCVMFVIFSKPEPTSAATAD